MKLFLIGIIILLSSNLIILFFKDKIKKYIFLIFSIISSLLSLLFSFNILLNNLTTNFEYNLGYFLKKTSIFIDPLSSFFIILINLTLIFVSIYSIFYMKHYENEKSLNYYYFFLSLLFISMQLVSIFDNILIFLVLWEIMSLSSFFLIIFDSEKEQSINAGINYFVNMQIGLIFLIIGAVIISIYSNNLEFSSLNILYEKNKIYFYITFFMFLIGFGFKAGFVPIHNWLPIAHPEAPSPVSAVMSGVMIKMGIYGILRIINVSNFVSIGISLFILILSIITALYSIYLSISMKDLKKILAYSSIENIGIIGMGIGLGLSGNSTQNNLIAVLGFSSALFHILNHMLYKNLLFYCAGSVYFFTHERNIDNLGGLAKYIPITTIFFLIGSIAIVGLPPMNGFISKFLLYYGFTQKIIYSSLINKIVFIIIIAIFSLIGILTLFSFSRALSVTFLGLQRKDYNIDKNQESLALAFPFILISIIIFIIGVFPDKIFILFRNVLEQFIHLESQYYNQIIISLQYISKFNILFIIISSIIILFRHLLLRNKIEYYKTWDCGYQSGDSKLQYSSSSFSYILNSYFYFMKDYKFEYLQDNKYFPKTGNIRVNFIDIFEKYIISNIIKIIEKFLLNFSWLQSGNTQQYLLYQIIFLIIILIWIIFLR